MHGKVLITGGAGFIGSHLSRRFLKEGFSVIVIDNLVTGRLDNIADLQDNPSFLFIQADVSDEIPQEIEFQLILHFASPASVKDYLLHPIETMKTGSFGTYNVLKVAQKKGARFILASTSEVYGDPLTIPQSEDYWGNVNPVGPRAVYDESKRFSEAMTMLFHRKFGLDVRIIRIFNSYGPYMRKDDGRVIPNFITQALSGKPITVYGTGKQTRSFLYIDDLIEATMKISLLDGIDGEVFNIGYPEEIEVLALAHLIKGLVNSDSPIEYLPLPEGDPARRLPDVSKAKRILGWKQSVPLKKGLMNTIGYFRNLGD
jgi:nucleoside-diphosphate-sugar epimerase